MTQQVGYIYFVRMGTFVKIGHTLDVAARMKTIQTSCPAKIDLLRLERGTVDLERSFHRQFEKYRTKGEWFAIQGALAKFLKECTAPVDIPEPIKRANFFDALLEPGWPHVAETPSARPEPL